jgi:uncharacterized protein (TIGR00730 family)
MSQSSQPQLDSPSYRLPALDEDFILGDSMRGVRFQLEYAKAEEALRRAQILSTLVVFGSARVRENGSTQHARWYEQARLFGRIASQRGGALRPPEDGHVNVIATGGGPGIMEAANRGASDVGAYSIGFNITLPMEQQPNAYTTPELTYTTPELTFRFHYFAMRKMHLAMRAAALIVFPGGFGTLDELFEVLTLQQTRKAPPIPTVLVDENYWRGAIDFDWLAQHGMVNVDDFQLFSFANDAEGAWDRLQSRGIGCD